MKKDTLQFILILSIAIVIIYVLSSIDGGSFNPLLWDLRGNKTNDVDYPIVLRIIGMILSIFILTFAISVLHNNQNENEDTNNTSSKMGNKK